jgi:hypothetical protein
MKVKKVSFSTLLKVLTRDEIKTIMAGSDDDDANTCKTYCSSGAGTKKCSALLTTTCDVCEYGNYTCK